VDWEKGTYLCREMTGSPLSDHTTDVELWALNSFIRDKGNDWLSSYWTPGPPLNVLSLHFFFLTLRISNSLLKMA
jgi:hypothetical protein